MNFNRPRADGFNVQEIRLAEAIAAQASLAIANARLYQQTLELSFTDALTGVPTRASSSCRWRTSSRARSDSRIRSRS